MKISVVSPVYNAEPIVDELVRRVKSELAAITEDYEIILVEDGSPDNSWVRIDANCQAESRVKGIKLSRNFGQHYAITAGLSESKGDFVIVMDCDLQDDPRYIKDLLAKANTGADIVYTLKEVRSHGFFKNLTAKIFYRVFNFLVNNKFSRATEAVGSYSLLSRKVVDAFLSVGDYRRHYLMVLRWLGFPQAFVKIQHQERYAGKSSYNLRKLIEHALDGITSQSDRLLRLTAGFGFVLSFFSFVTAILVIVAYFVRPFQAGWASLFVLILFVSGLIILSIGICGIYIGKIFEQTKNRPLFIVDKKINL